MALEPHDVFTPAGALSPGMFATRERFGLEQTVVDALRERGRHVVIHGWTGVGKTALVEHVCQQESISFLQVECGGTFEQLMHQILNRLDISAEVERVDHDKRGSEGGAKLLGTLTGRLSHERGSDVTRATYSGSIERVVLDALAAAELRVLFVDNLEDLRDDDQEREGLSRLMKMCSASTVRLGSAAPKLVVAGPTHVVQKMLLSDQAAARRTQGIEILRMNREEIEQILVRGQEKLAMEFDQGCRDQIVAYSGGFPYYAHLYALQCSRTALKQRSPYMTAQTFEEALEAILKSCSARLTEAYSGAIRGRGQPLLREGVLAALTATDQAEVSAAEVQQAFLKLHPQYERVERVRFVGRLLREFRDAHSILEDAWLDDGGRGYRFRDPLMRVYVQLRLLHSRNKKDAEWRNSLP